MIGRTLFRYLFRRQLVTFGTLLAGIVGLAVMIDLTETVSRFSELPGFTLGRALLLVALHLPPILEEVLPFTVLISSMIVLIGLNRRYELVVARSVGASAWQFLAPVAAASLVIGIVSLFTLNPLAAAALRWEGEAQAMLLGNGGRTEDDRRVWLRAVDGEGGLVIGAPSARADGRVLRNPTFYRIGPDGEMRDRIDATSATLGDGTWELENAVLTRAGAAPDSLGVMTLPTSIVPELVAGRATPPEATAFHALFSRIGDLRALGLPTAPFAMQLHALLTRPVLFVGMTLIAGTVCLRFARFGQARRVVLGGLTAAFVLYVATVLARAFGSTALVPPVTAAWVPVLAALFFGASVLLRTEDG